MEKSALIGRNDLSRTVSPLQPQCTSKTDWPSQDTTYPHFLSECKTFQFNSDHPEGSRNTK